MKYNTSIVLTYWKQCGLPEPISEYRFHPERKWRLDFAWPDKKVAIEVQGGIFIRGRHTQGAALLKEWEKLNTLACMGWRVLYCQPVDVMKLDFVKAIKECLK